MRKLKLGSSTYWNVKAKEVIEPIIDPSSPTLTELEGAIVTPREMDPPIVGRKHGQTRYLRGAIYDRDRQILPEYLQREEFELPLSNPHKMRNEPVLPRDILTDIQVLKGSYLYLGLLRPHFGHFLLESLSRIWYLLKHKPDCNIVVHGNEDMSKLPPHVLYTLNLIDFDLDRVTAVTRPVLVDHLLIPESEFEIRWKARAVYGDTFHEIYERSKRLLPVDNTPSRIYLTRRQLKIKTPGDRKKVVVNEEEVEQIFARRGFTIIAPEKLPFHQQIAFAAGAGQIAGMKGSALHMSLFCQRPHARVIQMGRVQSMNQSLIDGLKNMASHQILCQSGQSANGAVVDLETIRSALRQM
jgi:hypothetical protein